MWTPSAVTRWAATCVTSRSRYSDNLPRRNVISSRHHSSHRPPHSSLSADERKALAQLLYREPLVTPDELEARYPQRLVSEGAKVLRIAPSPTGFVHVGTVYMAMVNWFLSHQSGGIYVLRIEDTDEKREVEGATAQIIRTLDRYGLHPDEGFVLRDGNVVEIGDYGPYKQTARLEMYRSFARELIEEGYAYPCFCTAEDLARNEAEQRAMKVRPGYYGRWAQWRDAPLAKIQAALDAGQQFVIRFRSYGDSEERCLWEDGVKGAISAPSNTIDAVIIKSDGGSLYTFAHIIDDYLMRITDVIRGDEYISSVPLYMQIYAALGIRSPRLFHMGPLSKIEMREEKDEDTGATRMVESRRKLSKRKDPEANIDLIQESGFPEAALIDYLLNIANSPFEDWRKAHPFEPATNFILRTEKFSQAAAMFDLVKLADVSKETVARFTVEEIYEQGLIWAKQFDTPLAALMMKYPEYTRASLNIERDTGRGNKRIGSWRELRPQLIWFYDEEFSAVTDFPWPENVPPEKRVELGRRYLESYDPADPNPVWFNKCKQIAGALGFAPEVKEFKKNPGLYPGHVGDITMVLRVAASGRRECPDLFSVMQVLGLERVRRRVEAIR
ncbi:MAG: glutamate--tRNA ligase [Deltaproteobacteria bacterium]|nr:glutamate--tRNA ligase [Deltaproteobacteria bacterium]